MFSLLFFTLTIATPVETPTAEKVETVHVVIQEETSLVPQEQLTIAPDYLALANTSTEQVKSEETIFETTTDNQTQLEEQRTVTITNSIEPSMLAYKHWTGTYSPDIFTIQVNGTEIAPGNSYTLESTTTPLEIRYDYSFVNGTRKGGKIVSYTMNEKSDVATITFSWQDTWKVIVSNATPIKETTV